MSAHSGSSRRQSGFILLATLAIVLVMTLLASTIALTTERALADRAAADANLQAQLDAVSTASDVMYLLTTHRQTLAGLTVDSRRAPTQAADAQEDPLDSDLGAVGNEIRLDGTVYRGVGQIRFALRDDRGLVNVNWQGYPALLRFMNTLGVAPAQVPGLLAKLKDYQDADDLPRLNGAEGDAYRAAGLQPPSNRTLATPLELRRVLGWREALAGLSDEELLSLVSISRNPQLNVNTAAGKVLKSLAGLDDAQVAQALGRRRALPFASGAEFARYLGLVRSEDDIEQLATYPGGTGTLTMWSEALGHADHRHWALTPIDDGGRPWRTQYRILLPLPGNIDADAPEKPQTKVFQDALPDR